MTRDYKTIMKGLECCVNFYCEDCPYKQFDNNANRPMKCVHMLQVDIYKYLTDVGRSFFNGYIDGVNNKDNYGMNLMCIFETKEEAEKYKEVLRKLLNKEIKDEQL